MLASVPKHFNYILTIKKYCEKINIYFWTFDDFIDSISNYAISHQYNIFPIVMAQEYDNNGDSHYSKY